MKGKASYPDFEINTDGTLGYLGNNERYDLIVDRFDVSLCLCLVYTKSDFSTPDLLFLTLFAGFLSF